MFCPPSTNLPFDASEEHLIEPVAALLSSLCVAGPPVRQPGERLPVCGLPAGGGEVCSPAGQPAD